jgi:Skp family chaperone for outer membrane proteins
MKTKFILLFGLISISLFSQNSAYVHQDSILGSLPNYNKKMVSLDSIGKGYQNEIKSAKVQWNSKLADLLKPYNIKENEDIKMVKTRMSAIDTSKLEILIDEDKLLSKRAQNYDLMINTLYKNDIKPMLDKVNTVIEEYARLNKLDVIYIIEQIKPMVAYIDKRKNITKKIIAKISK